MRHCLIVDDSDVIRKVAKKIFEDVNITSTEAETCQEALERCVHAMPDLILLDWQTPMMSSTDFLQLLRKQEGGDLPFVIYCTTENDPDDIAHARACGANDVVMKPIDRESIERCLRDIGLV